MQNLKTYLAGINNDKFPLIIEDTWDFSMVQDTNNIGATHGWFDMFRSWPASPTGYLAFGNRPQPQYLRSAKRRPGFQFPNRPGHLSGQSRSLNRDV